MTGTNLIDTPGAFSNAVATLVAQIFDNVMSTYSQPATFVARLFFDGYCKRIIELSKRVLHQSDRIGSSSLKSFYCLLVTADL